MPRPDAKRAARRALDPVAHFLRTEAGGGFALLAAASAALVWVNLSGSGGYESLWTTELRIGVGNLAITEDLRHWVNDALMALFFFVISLEIKREIVTGELRRPRAAAVPVVAAAGGVALPAVIFLVVAGGGEQARGWGIPMATDAAFAIAVLAILGDRVGMGVKLLLVTLAVVDDVAAICVIAIAYTGDLAPGWLALAAAGLLAVAVMRRIGVASVLPYVPVGLGVWVFTLESGVHATLAGVALALLTPARPVNGRRVLEELEERLHPVTSFVVLPLFALANAGVELGGASLDDSGGRQVALAVFVGLVVGKFLGIAGATFVVLRLGLGALPNGVDRRGVFGVAALGGIGFTVSLFIAPLAYSDVELVDSAKIGILAASVVSAVIGTAILARGGRHPRNRHP
jgi:Na+:H+ antiporter, NhaA family